MATSQSIQKVRPGEPLRIPARAFNAFAAAANDYLARQHGVATVSERAFRQTGIVLVQNASGADRDRFDVLGIDGVVLDPGQSEPEFTRQIVLKAVVPDGSQHTGRFVVLQEPIAAGSIGKACLHGATVARLEVQEQSHEFADVADGRADVLTSCTTGGAQILWKDEGTGQMLAVVRMQAAPADETIRFLAPPTALIPAYGVFTPFFVDPFPPVDSYQSWVWVEQTDGWCFAAYPGVNEWDQGGGHNKWLDWHGTHFINGPTPVYPAEYGRCVMATGRPAWAAFNQNTGNPAAGETWGLAPGSYQLHRGLPGFRVIGPIAGTPPDYRVMVVQDFHVGVWFAKAITNWENTSDAGDNGCFVEANPCCDPKGVHTYDGSLISDSIRMRIWLPRYGRHRDPNVEAGDILTYSISAFHHQRPTAPTPWCFVAVGDYLDDPIGTVKLWTKTTAEIPKGWRQAPGSDGRFLRGANAYGGVGTFANVGTTHPFSDYVVIERYDNSHA